MERQMMPTEDGVAPPWNLKVSTGFSGRGGVPGRFHFSPSQLINKATPCLTTRLKMKIG